MHVIINGERRALTAPMTLDALLGELRVDARLVVVEHNRHIVKRPDFSHTLIQPDDQLEIVRIVGGGCG